VCEASSHRLSRAAYARSIAWPNCTDNGNVDLRDLSWAFATFGREWSGTAENEGDFAAESFAITSPVLTTGCLCSPRFRSGDELWVPRGGPK